MNPTAHSLPTRVRLGLRQELGPLLRLALPVVAAEIGWMSMGLVDTLLVGRLGAVALGAVSIGSSLFAAVAIFGMGMLFGLDYLVAHAWGGGRIEEAHRSFLHGVYLAFGLGILLMAAIAWALPQIGHLGIDPAVSRQAGRYVRALNWGLLPLLLFVALRRYLQAIGQVMPVMLALVSANVINLVVAWTLIFGRFGFRGMGSEGAGWATSLARFYLLLFLVVSLARHDRGQEKRLRDASRQVDRGEMRRLLLLGLPAAIQITLEVGVFAVASMLVGRLGAVPLGAHQVALVIASLTFMVPLGVSSAGAVRVGQALGAGDAPAARRAGWTALLLGVGFMSVAALVLATLSRPIVSLFTADAAVIATGGTLLLVAAVFQLFDGMQVVSSGILRGTGDTRMPMLANLLGHWLVGLPIGWYLGFRLAMGVVGIWAGLCVGLMAVGVGLLAAWIRRARRLPALVGAA